MVDRDAVRRGYDALADTYAAERAPEDRELDILESFVASLPDDPRVLDAGCGQGAPVLRRLAEAGKAVGVDFSGKQLGLAAENAPRAHLAQGDVTRLPVRDRTVDAVTAFHSLIHVPLAEHQQVVDEFARVLRPGGRVLVSEGTDEWQGTNPDWLDSGAEMQWHVAGAEATREHLREAGFTIAEERAASDELAAEESTWMFFCARLE